MSPWVVWESSLSKPGSLFTMASTSVQIISQGSYLDILPCLLSVMDCDLEVRDKSFLPQSCFCPWCFMIAVEVLREVPPDYIGKLHKQPQNATVFKWVKDTSCSASECFCLEEGPLCKDVQEQGIFFLLYIWNLFQDLPIHLCGFLGPTTSCWKQRLWARMKKEVHFHAVPVNLRLIGD